jgi:hypothetical protein
VTSEWWNDDDTLLAALTRAIREAEDVPPSFVEAGKIASIGVANAAPGVDPDEDQSRPLTRVTIDR